jgi:hypothetical protein
MQESVYELIIALYERDVKDRKIKKQAGKPIINMEKYIIDAFEKSEEAYIQMEKIKSQITPSKQEEIPVSEVEPEDNDTPVLNPKEASRLAKKAGMDYNKALKDFMEKFDKSDIYFRDIAKSKSVWQIKEFAIDLEQNAKVIGAERIAKLAEKVSLLFVYNNLDMLPVYIGKYHLELKKLMTAIKQYLAENR